MSSNEATQLVVVIRDIAIIIACIAWAGVGIRWSLEKDDDDSSGDGGKPVNDPTNPYNIDPQYDPSEWWKHDKEKSK